METDLEFDIDIDNIEIDIELASELLQNEFANFIINDDLVLPTKVDNYISSSKSKTKFILILRISFRLLLFNSWQR